MWGFSHVHEYIPLLPDVDLFDIFNHGLQIERFKNIVSFVSFYQKFLRKTHDGDVTSGKPVCLASQVES